MHIQVVLIFYTSGKREHGISKAMLFSVSVNGTKEALLNTQTNFEHLFQRPDAPEVEVDSSRTSLTGTGGTFSLGKSGGKQGKHGEVFKFESGVTFRSPGLELNDIGFLLASNEINHFTWAGMQWQRPFSIFRSARLNYNHWFRWDYSGQFLYSAFNYNAHATFKNNWQAGTGITWNNYEVSNNALRGGPSLRRPAGIGPWGYISTDFRKKVAFNLNLNYFWGFENTVKGGDYSLSIIYQPINSLNISLSGNYSTYWRRQDQFVTSINYNNYDQDNCK